MHSAFDFSKPRLMAILNATPDSFSDGGLLYSGDRLDIDKVANRVQSMVNEGTDIIDVGGESTRPGAEPITAAQELDRVLPIVEWIAKETNVAISVDTSTPEIMTAAAAAGAHLINDVRALSRPGAMVAAAQTQLPVCLMHMQGSPDTMQASPSYNSVVVEVSHYLQGRIGECLAAGISPTRIWVDPGFGFGKTLEHNLELLRQLPEMTSLGFPVLVGLSRKSMIEHLLKRDLNDRLPASLALGLIALERGAKILRVHDVAATRDIIDTFVAINC